MRCPKAFAAADRLASGHAKSSRGRPSAAASTPPALALTGSALATDAMC